MQRTYRDIPIGDSQHRHVVTLRDVPSDPGPPADARRMAFLMELVPDGERLMHCGPVRFQKLRMYHDGQSWVIDLEATEQ